MKKLLLCIVVLLVGIISTAQDKNGNEKNGFLVASAGPSFAVGDFGSTNLENDDAGLAKTGYNINLQWGYKFKTGIGVTVTGIYARHSVDISQFTDGIEGIKVDHWQYFGGLIGPLYSYKISDVTTMDFAVQAGIIRANSPRLTYNGEEIMPEEWATTMPLRGEIGFRFLMSNKAFIFAGVHYFYARPEFKTVIDGYEEEVVQKMSTVGINAGIGIAF